MKKLYKTKKWMQFEIDCCKTFEELVKITKTNYEEAKLEFNKRK